MWKNRRSMTNLGHFREKKITKCFIKILFVFLKSVKVYYSKFQNVVLNIMQLF